jgi:prepilin-type processing-associated H-X9-DG protein
MIELMVVIAMIALVLAVILPGIQSAREDARKELCKARLKQIGVALESYHGTHAVFPYASSCSFPEEKRFTNVKHAWTEFLLPFLNETPLYQHINFSESVDAGNNRELLEGILLPAYACPSNPFTETFKTSSGANFRDWAVNHYGPGDGPMQGLAYPLCAGSILPDFVPPDCKAGTDSFCVSEPMPKNGIRRWFNPQSVKSPGMYNRGVTSIRLKDVLDGSSQTIAAAERNAEGCSLGGVFSWNAPIFFTGQTINSPTRTRNPVDYTQNCGSSSHHEGGAHALFVDGSVRFLSNRIDFQTYCYLGDKDDGHNAKVPNE